MSLTTEVVLASAPHIEQMVKELRSIDGVNSVSINIPNSYPSNCVFWHNELTADQRAAFVAAVLAHDASTAPKLTVDLPSQVIASDGEATGQVKVTDSRGAAASGKVVKLRMPLGGDAGVDADSFVLDANGEAVATFQATTTFTRELVFEFYYPDAEADPVSFVVRRGSA